MRKLLPLIGLVALASCVSAPPPPEPRPAAPVVAPRPSPSPAPLAEDWRDWPVTPGDWRYRRTATGSVASFGATGAAALLSLSCDPRTRQITMLRPGTARLLTIRTTSVTRAVPASPVAGGSAAVFAATDPLLDAIGFSRGHFVVEGAGVPMLMLPAWAEVERVTEDCR